MTRLFIALLIALLAPALLTAAVPRTIIVGSLNLPSGGNPGTTVITLTPSTNFAVSDGTTKYNVVAPVTYSVSNSAALFMYVVPNTGSSNVPDYTTYTAQIKSNDKIVSTQTWQVGTSAVPLQAADVVLVSTTTVTPTNALPLAGGTLLGKLTLNSTALLSGLRWPLSTAPSSSPEEGDTYISSVDGKLYIFFGGVWTSPTGINAVQHYSDLTGNGTPASPLRITPGAAGSVMLTNTAGTTVTATAVTGDVTISGTGVTDIGALKVLGGMISTVPNNLVNVTASTTQTSTPSGPAFSVAAGKALNIVGQAGDPTSFAFGGISHDWTRKRHAFWSNILVAAGGSLPHALGILHNTADVGTVANQTSLTSFGTLATIRARSLAVGDVIHLDAWILHTVATSGTQSEKYDIQLGGTTIVDFQGNNYAQSTQQTNTVTRIQAQIHVRAIGASGSIYGAGEIKAGFGESSTLANAGYWYVTMPTAASTIDLTADAALTIRHAINVSNAANTATLKHVALWIE